MPKKYLVQLMTPDSKKELMEDRGDDLDSMLSGYKGLTMVDKRTIAAEEGVSYLLLEVSEFSHYEGGCEIYTRIALHLMPLY